MMKSKFILFILILPLNIVFAQVNIVVSTFNNETGKPALDSWERIFPDLLKAQFSNHESMQVVEREKLSAVLQEQALEMSGLIDTTDQVKIGKLLGADFVLTGKVERQGENYLFSAYLIRVKNGALHTEIARTTNMENGDLVAELIVHNISVYLFELGNYREKIELKSNSTWYWAGGTLLAGAATITAQSIYSSNLKKYRNSELLKDINTYYDNANISRKTALVFGLLTAIGAVGTTKDYFNNEAENVVFRGVRPRSAIETNFFIGASEHLTFGLTFTF